MNDSSVLSALTLSVLEAAEAVGFSRDELVAAAKLDESWLADPDARVPLPAHFALWQAISARPVGLELGARLGLTGLGVVGYALSHTDSVGSALAFLDRQRALIHPDAVPRMERFEVEGEARFKYVQLVPPPFARLVEPVDAQAAAAVAMIRAIAGSDVDPVAVRLPRRRPEGAEKTPHERFHRCAITWSAPLLEVEFRAAILARPLPRADERLFGYLARRDEALRLSIDHAERTSERVAREIHEGLVHGEPSLGQIGKRLGVSERTLHRRLRDEGTGFQALLDEVRRERAFLLLEDPRLSASEIAGLLGYADASAFFRAFKRWTGETPHAYRKRAER